jgi:hypothetical protein
MPYEVGLKDERPTSNKKQPRNGMIFSTILKLAPNARATLFQGHPSVSSTGSIQSSMLDVRCSMFFKHPILPLTINPLKNPSYLQQRLDNGYFFWHTCRSCKNPICR